VSATARITALAGLLVATTSACAKDPSADGDPGTTSNDAAACVGPGGSAAPGTSPVDAGPSLNCATSCDYAAGVTVGCATRFQFGVNYAWNHFGADFGGIGSAGGGGVSRDCVGKVAGDLADARANGADVVRWWVFPQLRSNAISFDGTGTPVGLGGTVLDDVEAALTLAAANDLHIQFCLFSFDDFKPATASSRSIQPIVSDPAKRAALIQLAVRPFIQAANASPYWDRVVSWDIINEPEWAISGQNPYGDPPYTPQTNLQLVTHAVMESFVADVIAAVRAESPLPITIGSAGAKWPRAWSNVALDFYTIHLYDWLNAQYPYSAAPADLGYTGKPLVVGEFPLGGLTGVPYAQLLASWYTNGYAGAMAWAVTDTNFNWPANKSSVKAFADATGCPARF
jgi:hypothetical protein